MHIVSLEDNDFEDLLDVLQTSIHIGDYLEDGKEKVVKVNHRLVMVSKKYNPKKIAIKPVRSLDEARELAVQILSKKYEEQALLKLEAGGS